MKHLNFLSKSRWLLVPLMLLTLSVGNVWGAIASGTYVLCTSTSDLEANAHYIIANGTSGTVKCVSNVSNNNNRKTVEASVSSSKITVAANSTIMTFTLGGNSTNGWTFYTDNYAGTAGYLASAASGNNNYCRVISTAETATISFSNNKATITLTPHTSRNILRYNTSDLFACYSSGQNDVYLYKKEAASGFSITYHCNGATSNCPSDATGQTKLPATLPTPIRTGCTFAGWYTNEALSTPATAGATLSANADLYAKWTCNVTLNRNGVADNSHTNVVIGTTLASLQGEGNQGGCTAWTFLGWSKTQRAVQDNSEEMTLVSTVDGPGPYYAVYKHVDGSSGSSSETFTFSDIADANNWENSVAYTTVKIGDVTILAQGGGNNGKWYTSSGGSWRMYSGGTVSISSTAGDITSVTSTPSCEFTISNGVATFSPSARTDFTVIEVEYDGGSTTYYSTTATCCTELGSINGSVNVTNSTPTGMELNWNNVTTGVSSWTVKYKTHDANEWQTYINAKTTSDASITVYSDGGTNNKCKCTIPTSCGTLYDFLIIANPANGYCDNQEELNNNNQGYNSGKYAITKSGNPAGTVTGGTFITKIGQNAVTEACGDATITLAATPTTGYSFTSWSVTKTNGGAEVSVTSNQFTMPAEAVTVNATFSKQHHNVVFHKNDGGEDETDTQDFTYGVAQNLKTISAIGWTRTNYIFGGWMTTSGGSSADKLDGASYTLNSESNVNLYALWVADNTRTISYSGDTHIASYSSKPETVNIDEDDEFSVAFTLADHYTLSGVAVTMGVTPLAANLISFDQSSLTVTAPDGGFTDNISVAFTIAATNYTVNWYVNGSKVHDQTAVYNTDYDEVPDDFSAFTDCSEFTFLGWKEGSAIDGGSTTTAPSLANVGTKITGNKNYYAVFAEGTPGGTTKLLEEDFAACDGTGANDGSWNGTIASDELPTTGSVAQWEFEKGNAAKACVKCGTGKAGGSATTPEISMSGSATLTFKAAAWDGGSEGTTLSVSADGGTLSASEVTLTKGAWDNYSLSISNVMTGVTISFYTSGGNNRFFLDDVVISQASTPEYNKWYTTCPHVARVTLSAANVENGSISFAKNDAPITSIVTEGENPVTVDVVAEPTIGYALTGVELGGTAASHASYSAGVITIDAGTEGALTATATFEPIMVTEVVLDETSLDVDMGASPVELHATCTPAEALVKTVAWTTSNGEVATVANGTVTFVAAGKATITATCNGHSATCLVTVNPAPDVVLDFTSNDTWNFPLQAQKGTTEQSFSKGGYTVKVAGGNGYYFDTNNLLIGKTDAYIELPSFDKPIDKIVCTGVSGGSGSVERIVLRGEEIVSEAAQTGCTDNKTFILEPQEQAESYVYTIKVTSNHNARFAKIKIYLGEVASVMRPTISGAVNFVESSEVTLNCATEGATIYYTINGESPKAEGKIEYSAPFNVTENTIVKAAAYKDGDWSAISTKTFTKGTLLTVAQALEAIEALGDNEETSEVFVGGIISTLDSYTSYNNSIQYRISADGSTTNQLYVHNGKGLDGANFEALTDLELEDIVIVYGKLKKYVENNVTKFEVNSPNYIYSLNRRESAGLAWSAATAAVGIIGDKNYATLSNPNGVTVTYSSSNPEVATISNEEGHEGEISLEAAGTTTISASFVANETYKSATVSYELEVRDILVYASISYELDGANEDIEDVDVATNLPNPLPTVTKDGHHFGGWFTDATFETPAVAGAPLTENTTLYVKWIEIPTFNNPAYEWQLVTSEDQLVAGKYYVLASTLEGKVASNISSNIMGTESAAFEDDVIAYNGFGDSQIADASNAIVFQLGGEAGAWTLEEAVNQRGLLGYNGDKKVQWGGDNTTWTIAIADNNATIVPVAVNTYHILYNVNNPRFTVYNSSPSASMLLPQLYVWAEKTYKLRYDANEGTNAPAATSAVEGKAIVTTAIPTAPAGKEFYCWSKNAAGTDAIYWAYDEVAISDADVTIYAIWRDQPTTQAIATVGGKFIINNLGDTAVFSRGNLQHQLSTNTWRTAPNQYEWAGETPNEQMGNPNYDGWVDLFSWSIGAENNYGATSAYHPALYFNKEFVDWGSLFDGDWSTLSIDEWYYMLYSRPNADDLWGMAMIGDTLGMVLLPGNWEAPSGVTFVPGTMPTTNIWDENDIVGGNTDRRRVKPENMPANKFTTSEWTILENAGAVFCPYAGRRSGGYGNHTNRDDVEVDYEYNFTYYENYQGAYWTSTVRNAEEGKVYWLPTMCNGCTGDAENWGRGAHGWWENGRYGHSVRLVHIIPRQYSVTYNANGATSGSVPTDSEKYLNGEEVTVAGKGDLKKTGYTFAGWKFKGTTYQDGDTYTISGVKLNEEVEFVAQWEALPVWATTYTSNVTVGAEDYTIKILKSGSTTEYDEFEGQRYGSGSAVGVATIYVPQGTQKLHFHAAGWNNENITLSVKVNDVDYSNTFGVLVKEPDVQGNGKTYIIATPVDEYYCIDLSSYTITENSEIKFTATGGNRFVLFGVNQEGGVVPVLDHIVVSGELTNKDYELGDNLNTVGLTVTAYYTLAGEPHHNVDVTEDVDWSYDPLTGGQTSVDVTATYEGKTNTLACEINAVVVPDPEIVLSESELAFSGKQYSPVANQTFNVQLKNVAAATIALSGDDAAKFSIDETSLTANGTITVSANTDAAGSYSATITVSDDAHAAASQTVALTLTVTADEAPAWNAEWVVAEELYDGMPILITGMKDAATYAMGAQGNNNRAAVLATVDGNGVLTPGEGTKQFTLEKQDDGTYAIKTTDGKYLYAASSSANHLKTQASVDANAKWTMSVTSASAESSSNRHVMQFNGGSSIFACYATASQANIKLYTPKTYKREISGNIGTICLPNRVEEGDYFGATFYRVMYKKGDPAAPNYVQLEEVGALEAGRPYIFVPNDQENESVLRAVYRDKTAVVGSEVNDDENHGLYGTFAGFNVDEVYDVNNDLIYILNSNKIRRCGTNCTIGVNRAYIKMDEVLPEENQPVPAPGRRQMTLINGDAPQTPTGMENVQSDDMQCIKIFRNGNIYILRGGKMYDVTGKLVK